MNELTRRAANALVATVDFFSGALAAESQAGEEKQKQLDALAVQLRERCENADVLRVVEDQLDSLRKERDGLLREVQVLREGRSVSENPRLDEKPVLSVEESRKILVVLQHARRILAVFPRKSKGPLASFSGIVDDLERAMKDLDQVCHWG